MENNLSERLDTLTETLHVRDQRDALKDQFILKVTHLLHGDESQLWSQLHSELGTLLTELKKIT